MSGMGCFIPVSCSVYGTTAATTILREMQSLQVVQHDFYNAEKQAVKQ